MQLILTAFIVCFGLTSVRPNHQIGKKTIASHMNEDSGIQANFHNFFDSITNNDGKRTKTYRTILKQDAVKEQLVFDTMKEDLQFARQKNAHKKLRNVNPNVIVSKREISGDNRASYDDHESDAYFPSASGNNPEDMTEHPSYDDEIDATVRSPRLHRTRLTTRSRPSVTEASDETRQIDHYQHHLPVIRHRDHCDCRCHSLINVLREMLGRGNMQSGVVVRQPGVSRQSGMVVRPPGIARSPKEIARQPEDHRLGEHSASREDSLPRGEVRQPAGEGIESEEEEITFDENWMQRAPEWLIRLVHLRASKLMNKVNKARDKYGRKFDDANNANGDVVREIAQFYEKVREKMNELDGQPSKSHDEDETIRLEKELLRNFGPSTTTKDDDFTVKNAPRPNKLSLSK